MRRMCLQGDTISKFYILQNKQPMLSTPTLFGERFLPINWGPSFWCAIRVQQVCAYKITNHCVQRYTVCSITGSTVVLTCCKGDSSNQWETPIFGPPQTENPLTDLDKICHQ